jgi:beta-lactamase superfamily II metal-dependent hydrolase
MQYQIDFLPVGKDRCGEAIAIRFGNLETGDPDQQAVVVIDGGYKKDTDKVINMVTNHYGANKIDLVVSTHPDIDHIGGLVGVTEKIPIDYLWMHQPWEHSDEMLALRQEDFSVASMTKKLQKSMQSSGDLAAAADAAGVNIFEPFTGRRLVSDYGTLTVLGPTRAYYEELLVQILAKSATKASQQQVQRPLSLAEELQKIMQQAAQKAASVIENHHFETLTDKGTTALTNNTSTVLLLELIDGKKFLFCGDAGMPALEMAYDQYTLLGNSPGQLNLIQVPHHGSRKNVGPTILNKFLGEPTSQADMWRGSACVSVTETCEGDGHPHKVATNAFKRRGYPVIATQGSSIKFGFPRIGWDTTATPLPLFESVEADG